MALGKCPTCDGVVSMKAKSCPHCGHSFDEGFLGAPGLSRFLNVGCLALIIIIALFALIVIANK
jgi:hypothetical protein